MEPQDDETYHIDGENYSCIFDSDAWCFPLHFEYDSSIMEAICIDSLAVLAFTSIEELLQNYSSLLK